MNKIRLKSGMTQAQLSALADITINEISCIENNKTYPTAYTLWRLAGSLNCKVDDLYEVVE